MNPMLAAYEAWLWDEHRVLIHTLEPWYRGIGRRVVEQLNAMAISALLKKGDGR